MTETTMTSTINFEDILSSNAKIQQKCLDKLVEEVNDNKEKTIYNFLNDAGSEDFLWSIISLLSAKDIRIASNAAYIIGSLAETELGSDRVLSFTEGKKSAAIIQDLTNMLMSEDSETVMNAAGTLGTLAETDRGRKWMLEQSCIVETLSNITDLLNYENNWVASNAALVLARLTISEDGCQKVLKHQNSSQILSKLINSLGSDSAGRGMNAAFAIGRLLDMAPGKQRLLKMPETEKMISTLCRMLCKGDMGSAKNACFAVSCLAADADGNNLVLNNTSFNDVLNRLILLLNNDEDVEAQWFAAMTLRTLSSQHRGVLHLRGSDPVLSSLNKNANRVGNTKELNDEIHKTLQNLKRLDAPAPPCVSHVSSNSVRFTWERVFSGGGNEIVFKLFEGSKIVYKGKDTVTTVDDLNPNTTYRFKMKLSTIGDESPFSEIVSITTEEGLSSAPSNLKVIGSTPSQIRVSWSQPEYPNGTLRGYSVYLGEKLIDSTNEMSFIFGRLQASTSYTIHVCASTSKGVGDRASVSARTEELGAHAPGRPSVTVIGRNEVHVTWNPPAVPLGRFFRYELLANKEVIYTGTDRSFYATNLTPDKDYSFTVCAITSEGRCESEATKKRTHKDKTQSEPGRHASKTHSFKAKSKTQSSITVRPKIKTKKQAAMRPNSCASALSEKSRRAESVFTSRHDGSWANTRPATVSTDTTDSTELKSSPSLKYNSGAVLGGAVVKVDIQPTLYAAGKGNLSMFLQKSNSDFPIRLNLTEKAPGNHNRVAIEPVSWNEMLTVENEPVISSALKKVVLPKPKPKTSTKLESIEIEKSFINLLANVNKTQKSSFPKLSAIDKFAQERKRHVSVSLQPEPRIMKERRLRRKPLPFRRSPLTSDSSSDEPVEFPIRDTSNKLEPLTLADVIAQKHVTTKSTMDSSLNLDEPKQMVAQLRASAKGYWSDHDAYSVGKKKNTGLTPINYKAFKEAHRPTKTFRRESPLVSEQWFTELPSGVDKNKYKFVPTQLRTQPVHLPRPGKIGHRLESLTQLDLRQNSSTRFAQPKSVHDNHRSAHQHRSFDSNLSQKTKSGGSRQTNKPLTSQDRGSAYSFKTKLLSEDSRSSPQQKAVVAHGDVV